MKSFKNIKIQVFIRPHGVNFVDPGEIPIYFYSAQKNAPTKAKTKVGHATVTRFNRKTGVVTLDVILTTIFSDYHQSYSLRVAHALWASGYYELLLVGGDDSIFRGMSILDMATESKIARFLA